MKKLRLLILAGLVAIPATALASAGLAGACPCGSDCPCQGCDC